MKEINLVRLMDSCCAHISREYYEELYDYLIESDVDLNTLNLDDLVVNGIQFINTNVEFNQDNYYVLSEVENGFWVI